MESIYFAVHDSHGNIIRTGHVIATPKEVAQFLRQPNVIQAAAPVNPANTVVNISTGKAVAGTPTTIGPLRSKA